MFRKGLQALGRLAGQQTQPQMTRWSAARSIHQSGRALAEGRMPLTFASPARVFYNRKEVSQVDVPLQSGAVGILPGHVPTIGVIKAGVVTVYEEKEPSKYFVSSGTLTVNDDASVQLLAEEAAPLDDLDPAAIREGLAEAQQATSSSDDTEKLQAQVQIEVYEEMQKSVGA